MSTKNNWINHVKQYASKKGISYKDALKSQTCKSSYKKNGGSLNINDMPRDVGNVITSYLRDEDMINLRQSNALPDNETELNRRAHKEIGRKVGLLGKRDIKYKRYQKIMMDPTKSKSERIDAAGNCINFIFNMFNENQINRFGDIVTKEDISFLLDTWEKLSQSDDRINFLVDQLPENERKRIWNAVLKCFPKVSQLLNHSFLYTTAQTSDSMGVL